MRTRCVARLVAYAILVSVLPSCSSDTSTPADHASFAIFRPSDHSLTYEEALLLDISQIPLEPEPVISGAEIEWYSWSDHAFDLCSVARERLGELGQKMASDFRSEVPGSALGKPFVVTVAGNPRYVGVFWCDPFHPTAPMPGLSLISHNLSQIPYMIFGPRSEGAVDPRNDELVHQSLIAAGVIR
jgi:hypothetical protein